MTDASDEIIYRFATYAPLVGSRFEIHRPDGGSVSLELVDATGKLRRVDEHASLGEFPLFLVPLGPCDGGQQLEAVVNRLEA